MAAVSKNRQPCIAARTLYCLDHIDRLRQGYDIVQRTMKRPDRGLGTVKSFGKTTDAVEALKNGQVDCVILDNEPAKALVAANEGLHILDTEYAVEDYAIAIAKENTDLLEKVNKALAELTADGTLQSIVDKYIGK